MYEKAKKLPTNRDLQTKWDGKYHYAMETMFPGEYHAFSFVEWRDHWVKEGFGTRVAVKASTISYTRRLEAYQVYNQEIPRRFTHVGEHNLPHALIRMIWEPIEKHKGQGCASEIFPVAYRLYKPTHASHWSLQVNEHSPATDFNAKMGWFPICDIDTSLPIRFKSVHKAKCAAYSIEEKLCGWYAISKSKKKALEVAKMPLVVKDIGTSLTGDPRKMFYRGAQ